MDTPRSESSFYLSLNSHKSSAPIEIPGRHRPARSTRPMSPDLIFEMDPISEFPAPPNTPYTAAGLLTTTCTMDEREPLLYTFPRFSSHPFDKLDDRAAAALPTPQSTAGSSSRPGFIARKPLRPRTQSTVTDSPRQRQLSTCPDPCVPIKTVPVHKITGFRPDSSYAAQAPEPRRPPSASTSIIIDHRELPAPRETPLTASPRISSALLAASVRGRSGRGEVSADDEPRSLERDSGALDFGQYLIRRIDRRREQQPAHFNLPSFQAVMSVSVR